jgi:polyhydroxybutyrate depolymerase
VRPSFIIATAVAIVSLSSAALAQSSLPAATSCALSATPGVSEQRLSSGGQARTYRLFVPPSYNGRTPLPLVLDLHGSGGNSAGQASTSRFEALAEREVVLVATLQAESSRWNVPVQDGRPDDVQYVSDVIDHLAERACVDLTRVYATGFSGGGRMTSLLGCRLNARIAAIAPMAGLRWPGPCDGRAIPVLTVHGLADPQNTYDGRVEGRGGEWVESVPEALARWAEHNGCDADAVEEDPPGPLSTLRYEGCDAGAEVQLIRVDGLEHRWAREEVDATVVMWAFFRRHAL